ncbi:hypothetical protein [Emticicia sp. 17c]|uniref:hypothetical protein n=1 Tax=Emticicia sp. 17c TaxID=3127704 RepID=UPI00301DBA69
MGTLPKQLNLLLLMTEPKSEYLQLPKNRKGEPCVTPLRLKKKKATFANLFCTSHTSSYNRTAAFTGVYPIQHETILISTENIPYSAQEPAKTSQNAINTRLSSYF